MRKWLAGLLSSLGLPRIADRIYPHYSERMLIEQLDNGATHDVPETWSDERAHEMSPDCWCGPEFTLTQGATGPVYRHRKADRTPWHDGICVRL